MPEPDPIAELLARVVTEHLWRHTATTHCACGWRSPLAQLAVEAHVAHVAEEQAAVLWSAGHVVDGAAEVEWAVVDRGRTIHIEGATCPADVLAGAHGHGATRVGVARRTATRTPWQPINHGQENP